MRKKENGDLQVIQKTYDLVLWSCHHIAKFPRSARFTLGERLERRLYDVLENLLLAKYRREKADLLRRVNLDLEILRYQFRLSHDLRCLSTQSYGHASRNVNGIGQMVGGWLKRAAREPNAGANG